MGDLVGNEFNFMQYSEKVVKTLQTALREQQNLHDLPVIEIALKIEEIVYNQAIKNCGLQNADRVWDKLESVRWYQAKCEKICRNAQLREFNVTHVESTNANAILQDLFREDYTAPKQSKPRARSATSTAKTKSTAKKGVVGGMDKPQLLQQQQQQLLQEQYNFVAMQPPPLVSTFSLPTPHFMPKQPITSNEQINFNNLMTSSSASPPLPGYADDGDDGFDFLEHLEDSNFSNTDPSDMNWASDLLISPAGKAGNVAYGGGGIATPSAADLFAPFAMGAQTPSLQQKREQERAERESIQQTVNFDAGDGGDDLLDLMDF